MANNGISKETMKFLSDLKKNNDRGWFEKNKDRFNAAQADFNQTATELIERLGKLDPSIRPVELKDCVFRIYRDVRFSRDKSPYKTHFAFFAARGGRKSKYAGYYVHIEPGDCMLGGGIWHPEPENLARLRGAIASRGAELRKILAAPGFKKLYPELEGDRLKSPPKQYARDHAQADLLCHKDFIVSAKLSNAEVSGDLIKACLDRFKPLVAFNRWLSQAVD